MGKRLANAAFLEIATTASGDLDERFLLPHEEAEVERMQTEIKKKLAQIVSEKVAVTGGDDWHDGAFRQTDNEANIARNSFEALRPFMAARVVEYPGEEDERVTLGSRVLINLRGNEFPVDVVGMRSAYPNDVVDPETREEVEGVSIESPLGKAIIGKKVGDTAEYEQKDRSLEVTISRINQLAVAEYFMGEAGVELVVPEVGE